MGPRAKFRTLLHQLKEGDMKEKKPEKPEEVTKASVTLEAVTFEIQPENMEHVEINDLETKQQDVKVEPQIVNRKQAIPKAQITAKLAPGTQMTLNHFLKGKMDPKCDRYGELRRIGFKVFEQEFLDLQTPMKRAWYEFWNKKALDLAHENTKRSYMEGLIKKAWSYEGGRQIALCKFGKEICKAQKLENDPFSCYEQAAEQKQNEIQKLETEKTEKEQELCSRIYKGTISMNDKVSLRKHIKLITVDAEKAEKDYSKILTNWTAHAYKVERRGVEKKKPGRKRKAEIQEIKYLTAKELRSKKSKVDNQSAGNQDKSMESNDMFVEDPAEITSDNHDEGMESNDVMFVEDPAEITKDNHDEGMESNDVMFVEDPAEITRDNNNEGMEKKNQEKQKKNPMTKKNMTLFIPQTYDTYLGIKLLFPGISQNTVGLPHGLSRGSNACTGFCLKLAEHFFNEKFSLHIKPALSEYRSSLHEIVSRYEDRNIQMMDTKSAMTYFGYQNSMKIISDTYWHRQLGVGADDPLEICSAEYNRSINSQEREALFITVSDKTFIILNNEEGDQVLFDSHVHYTDDNMTLEDTLNRKDLHGLIAASDKTSNMLMYVFAHVVNELRCSTDTGCMYRCQKN
ncbi:uncharacterized protein LOC127704263 isoform X2 [Mytilus californianus]|uniref:uncharacterized protein LOC127704263 isoform X2 n=1 Tax=Mytilus californianus TaxID=6549 RepID=UPI0022472480|nr:uncharacterized protein LOC127704263 isoform X2 [Mytilus californianus]